MKLQEILQFSLTVLLFSTFSPVVAQTPDSNAGPRTAYPSTGRAVRVQYLSGEVSVAPSGTNDWVAVGVNRLLSSNTYVWTDKNSRVELNVGDGFIRMNSEASLTLIDINRSTVRFQVSQGLVSLTVQRLLSGEIYEIDTPNAVLTVMKAGVYRIDVHPDDGQTSVTVRRGSVAATGQGRAVTVNAGDQVRFRVGTSLQHVSYMAPAPDGFDDWVNVRNQRLGGPQRVPYFAFGIVGFGPWGAVAVRGPLGPPPPVWAPYP